MLLFNPIYASTIEQASGSRTMTEHGDTHR
jgi:hypothetical protein